MAALVVLVEPGALEATDKKAAMDGLHWRGIMVTTEALVAMVVQEVPEVMAVLLEKLTMMMLTLMARQRSLLSQAMKAEAAQVVPVVMAEPEEMVANG